MQENKPEKYWVDLKGLVVERSAAEKQEPIYNFLWSCIEQLSLNTEVTEQQKTYMKFYLKDYVSYVIKQKTPLQKDLRNIILDVVTSLSSLIKYLPDPSKFLGKEADKEIDAVIDKNTCYLKFYTLRDRALDYIKAFKDYKHDIKFYFSTKYPLKEEGLRYLLDTEAPDLLHHISFNPWNSIGENDALVTSEPKQLCDRKQKLIYHCSDTMSVYRKLVFEKSLSNFEVMGEISCLSQLEGAIKFYHDLQKIPVNERKVINIGYHLVRKKFYQLQDKDGVVTSEYPLKFTPIDLRLPVTRPIDIFFQKFTDYGRRLKDPINVIRLAHFEQDIKGNKNIILTDDYSSLDIVSDRVVFQSRMLEVFQSENFKKQLEEICQKSGQPKYEFDVPKLISIDVNKTKKEDVIGLIQKEKLKYPFIVKTLEACGEKTSHYMALVLNEKGMKKVQENEIFQ